MEFDIPGFSRLDLKYLVTDYTGTLSVDGKLLPGVAGLLAEVGLSLTVHVLTADTFGKARAELAGVKCVLQVMSGSDIAEQKEFYIDALGGEQVVAVGNGNNDRLMLKAARLGIAVIEGEGGAVHALVNADIVTRNIHEALRQACRQQPGFPGIHDHAGGGVELYRGDAFRDRDVSGIEIPAQGKGLRHQCG